VAYTVAAAATLVLVARQAGMPQWKIDWRYLVDNVMKPALPYALVSFFMIVYFRAGTLMIGLLTGRQDLVGYYNAGYRLVESYMLFPSLVLAPLYPVFARNLDDRVWIRELLLKASRIVLVVSVSIAVPMSLFRSEFTLLFYGTPFEAAAPAVGIVTLSMIPVGMTWVYGTLVAASGRQGRANLLIFLITIVNILLNYVLIPIYLEIGAAITTLVTEVAVALVSIWIVRDFIEKRSFLMITAKASLIALLIFALHEFDLLPGPFWLRLAICLCIMSAAFFALRLVTLADLKKIGFGD
jgi:O-antigen/teichoic acid export membrane protein